MSDIVDVDVIVIGAGVVGCSLALRLAQAGRRVRVLEQGAHVAPGASSLNAGLVRVFVFVRSLSMSFTVVGVLFANRVLVRSLSMRLYSVVLFRTLWHLFFPFSPCRISQHHYSRPRLICRIFSLLIHIRTHSQTLFSASALDRRARHPVARAVGAEFRSLPRGARRERVHRVRHSVRRAAPRACGLCACQGTCGRMSRQSWDSSHCGNKSITLLQKTPPTLFSCRVPAILFTVFAKKNAQA
jgi:hypothetical protein